MKCSIDEKDLQIIDILNTQGDLTTRQISKKTGLPTTTTHNRIKRLKETKVIRKFTIQTDPKKLKKGFLAYILISISIPYLNKQNLTQHDIAKKLKKFYFIERVDIVSGIADMIATVRVKDVEEFDMILLGKIQKIDGIKNTSSLIAIHPDE